jgi:probable rRNA maturation factor
VSRSLYLGPWRIDLTIRDGVAAPVAAASLARAMVRAAEAASAPSPASIGLILSDDAELASLNSAHLGQLGPTDVLSFPLLPPEAYPAHEGGPARPAPGTRAGAPAAFPLPPGRRPHLGDVVISVERAIAQAVAGRGGQTGDRSWAPSDELRLLAVHGTLHLGGWDHADPAEEAAMRGLEAKLLAFAGAGSRRPPFRTRPGRPDSSR